MKVRTGQDLLSLTAFDAILTGRRGTAQSGQF